MALSYSLRLVCLIVVSAGLLQVALEILLWIGSPLLLRFLAILPIRQRERALYLVRLAPFVLAMLITVSFCVPWYLSNETNFAAERVGSLCLVLAAGVSAWYGISAFTGLRIALRTVLFTRACRRDGQGVLTPSGTDSYPRLLRAEPSCRSGRPCTPLHLYLPGSGRRWWFGSPRAGGRSRSRALPRHPAR